VQHDIEGDLRRPRTSALPATMSPRRVFWLAFCVLASAMLLWAIGNAPMASPDEPAHVVKAAAVARGELGGVPDPGGPGSGSVRVPQLYAYSLAIPGCYAFQPDATAACIPPEPADPDASTTVSTWVIRNNPLYYAIVGLPTLLPSNPMNFYLMRAMSALLNALVLAWGFRALTEIRNSRLVALGVFAATTPMVLFLGSTVNSSALEISAALALWVSLLALLRSPDPAKLPVRMAGIAALAILLANSRGLSPLFLVVIAVTAVAASPWSGFMAVLRGRRSWPWLALTMIGSGAALGWIAHAGTLASGGTASTGISFLSGLKQSIRSTPGYVTSMIGQFGWLDTALPQWLYLLLVSAIAVPIVLALILGRRRRDALLVAGAGAMAVVLPVLIQAWQAKSVGLIWQGRYSLPLMVGFPLVAGFVAREGAVAVPAFRRRSVLVVPAIVLAVGHVGAYAYNLHRYIRGTSGSWFVPSAHDWNPPVPALVLLAAYAITMLSLVVLIDRATRRLEPSPEVVPATAAELQEATP